MSGGSESSVPVAVNYLSSTLEEMGHLCGLVVRVSGYRMEMYCASCEVQTEFIYVM
jgi:hypothetical protein